MSDTTSPYDDEVVDPYSDDDTKNPHEETVSEPGEDDTEEAPKRKAGRPRKSAS